MPSLTLGPTAGTIDETTKTVNVGGGAIDIPANAVNVSITATVEISVTQYYWEDYWQPYSVYYDGSYNYYGYNNSGYGYYTKYNNYYLEDIFTDSASTELTYSNGTMGRGSVQFSDYWSNSNVYWKWARNLNDVVITYTATWDVPPPAPTLSVSVSPGTTVPAGTTCTVSWSSSNATGVSIDGSANATSGSFPVTRSTGTSTVTFVATGATGSNPATATERVTISWLSAPNPTINLTTSVPSPQFVGTPITLSWSTTNATRVAAEGADQELSGSRVFTDLAAGTYTPTFTAYGGPGSTPQTASLTFVVKDRPPAAVVVPTGDISWSSNPVTGGSAVTVSATLNNATSGKLYIKDIIDRTFTGSTSYTFTATENVNASLTGIGTNNVNYLVASNALVVNYSTSLVLSCQPQVNPGATFSVSAGVANAPGASGTLRYTLPSGATGTIVISTPANAAGANFFSVTAPSVPGVYEIRGEYITSAGSSASDSVSFTVVDNTPQPLYGAPALGSLGNFTNVKRGSTTTSNSVALPVGTVSSRGFRPGVVDLDLTTTPAVGTVDILPASTVASGSAFSIRWAAPADAEFGRTYTAAVSAAQSGTSGTSSSTASFTIEAASGNHPADYGDWQLLDQELGPDSSPVLGPPSGFSGGNKVWDMTVSSGAFTNGDTVFQYPESGRPAVSIARSTAYNTETTKTITIQERGVASTARSVTARVKTKVYVPPAPGAIDFEIGGQKEPEVIATTNAVTLSSVVGTRSLTVTPAGDSSIPGMSLSELYASLRTVTINGVANNISGAGSFPLTVQQGDTVSITVMSAPFDPGSSTRTKSFSVSITGGPQATASDSFTVITRAPSRDPGFGSFDFDDLSDLNPSTRYESNSVLITNVDPSIPVAVTVNGDSALDPYITVGGVNKGTSAVVYRGDAFKISAKTAPSYATPAQFSVTLANRVQPWTITTRIRDISPDSFNFPSIDGCERSTAYETITQRISGVEGSVSISVTGGAKLIINGTNTNASTGTVVNGDQISILADSSGNFTTPITYRVTIESIFDDFTVTTRARSSGVSSAGGSGVNGLTNAGHGSALPKTRVTSNTITLSGFDDSLPISCSTANLYVNGVLIPSGSTTATAGDTVYLTFTTTGLFFETVVHTLTVGAYTGQWTVKTVPNFDLGVMAEF